MLIARGHSDAQIANELVLTSGTASNHVAHILRRLGCRSRAQVAAWAVQNGLVSVDQSVWVKQVGGKVWMALALAVPTRLWPGGAGP